MDGIGQGIENPVLETLLDGPATKTFSLSGEGWSCGGMVGMTEASHPTSFQFGVGIG